MKFYLLSANWSARKKAVSCGCKYDAAGSWKKKHVSVSKNVTFKNFQNICILISCEQAHSFSMNSLSEPVSADV